MEQHTAESAKIQMTIKLQKKRDSWEKKVRIAYAQAESMKNNFNIYRGECTNVLGRYKKWLKENNIDPLLDLTQYK